MIEILKKLRKDKWIRHDYHGGREYIYEFNLKHELMRIDPIRPIDRKWCKKIKYSQLYWFNDIVEIFTKEKPNKDITVKLLCKQK